MKIKYHNQSGPRKVQFSETDWTTSMFDEVWFDSMSTFVTKFCSLNNGKNCFAIAPGDELKIFWLNPLGDEVLIENDVSLQMALEVSRKLYTPDSKLLSAVTGLQNSSSPNFKIRVINEGADWRRQFWNESFSSHQLELYGEAARKYMEEQNLPNVENFSLRFPGDYQNAKICSLKGWASFLTFN